MYRTDLFDSPNLYDYYVNRELFYDITIWCTVIYFAFAWWDLQRSKAATRNQVPVDPVPASQGSRIEPNDPYWDVLTEKVNSAKAHPHRWIEMRNICGDLADEPCFADAFAHWPGRIYDAGMEAALNKYLNG